MTIKHKLLESLVSPMAWFIRIFIPFSIMTKRVYYYLMAKTRITDLNPTIQLEGLLDISGTGRIEVGDYCRIGKIVQLETTNKGEISLGERVRLNRGVTLVSYGKIEIGSHTLIGEFTSIRDANHGMKKNELVRNQDHSIKAVTLGSDVWVGRGVCILSGVTIGEGSVIGANSVVTKDIPAYSIAAGIPAKVIKLRE